MGADIKMPDNHPITRLFMCDVVTEPSIEKPPHRYNLRSISSRLSSSHQNPVLFDIARLRTLFQVSYDFRVGLFNALPVTDLSHLVQALDMAVTANERAEFLNPIRVFFNNDMEKIKSLTDRGWGITLYGYEIEHVLNNLLTPENERLRWVNDPECGPKSGPECTMLFTQPQESPPSSDNAESSYVGSQKEFDEVMKWVSRGQIDEEDRPNWYGCMSNWSCASIAILSYLGYRRGGGTREKKLHVDSWDDILSSARDNRPKSGNHKVKFGDPKLNSGDHKLKYMNLHVSPLEMKTIEARHVACPVEYEEDEAAAGHISGFHSWTFCTMPDNDTVPRNVPGFIPHEMFRHWAVDVPITPCCENEEDQWIMGKSLKDQLGEKVDAGSCRCECHVG